MFLRWSFSGGGADYAEYFEWKDGNVLMRIELAIGSS